MTTEKEVNVNNVTQRVPSTLELQEMIKELAVFCDDLKNEVLVLRRDLILHEHGKGGVLVPVSQVQV